MCGNFFCSCVSLFMHTASLNLWNVQQYNNLLIAVSRRISEESAAEPKKKKYTPKKPSVSEGVYSYLEKRAQREHEESMAKIKLEQEKLQLERDKFELEKRKFEMQNNYPFGQ